MALCMVFSLQSGPSVIFESVFKKPTNDDLGVQALIWICVVQFGTSCANLRPPHIFKQQIYGENPRLAFE
jgi:hypothetical protein